jgi:hypothetical protein
LPWCNFSAITWRPPRIRPFTAASVFALNLRELRDLIRRMNMENPLWGAPRIHGELLKIGFKVGVAARGVGAAGEAADDRRSWLGYGCGPGPMDCRGMGEGRERLEARDRYLE